MLTSFKSPIIRLKSNSILRYKCSNKSISSNIQKRLYARKKNSLEIDYKQEIKKNEDTRGITKTKPYKFNYKTYRYKGM